MKKDKEWYSEVLNQKLNAVGEINKWHSGYKKGIYECLLLYKEIEEPKITEEKAWKVIAEKHNQNEDYWEDAKIHYLNKLDEPELPVIPKLVADWYEEHKDNIYYHVSKKIQSAENNNDKSMCLELIEFWLMDFENENIGKILKMKDGYTIEQPKMLTVIVKSFDKTLMNKQMPEDEVNKMMEGLEK